MKRSDVRGAATRRLDGHGTAAMRLDVLEPAMKRASVLGAATKRLDVLGASTTRAFALVLLFAACKAMPSSVPSSAPNDATVSSMPITPASKLLVPASSQSQMFSPATQGRTLPSPGEGSRSRLLEMHQELAKERDKLATSLSASEADRAGLADALDRIGTERADALRELAAARERIVKLEAQNMELAQRLVTAQIRRLEAEKLLLVSRLAVVPEPSTTDENAKGASVVPKSDPQPSEGAKAHDAPANAPAKAHAPAKDHEKEHESR